MRVMLNTNVFISRIFFPSNQTRELARRFADELPIVRDSKASPILVTAILENVDVLVTGDKDFLVPDVEMPDIATMTEFLERY